jgi:hypothetical protein
MISARTRLPIAALFLCAAPLLGADRVTPAAPLATTANSETPTATREWKEGAELVRAFVSSPRANGAPGTFSAWYALESPPPPEGFHLKASSFHVVGDRFCAATDSSPSGAGTAVECRQDLRNDRAARWVFRMQGHDDGVDPEKWTLGFNFSLAKGQLVTSGPAGTSRGVLLCTYAPGPAQPPPPAK